MRHTRCRRRTGCARHRPPARIRPTGRGFDRTDSAPRSAAPGSARSAAQRSSRPATNRAPRPDGYQHDRTSAPVAERRDHQRIEPLRELAERAQIAVVVMVVTQQHDRDRRQVVERHRRLPDSPRSDHVQRACALGVHRVGQDVPRRRLNQKRRVTDERDDGDGAVQSRRPSRRRRRHAPASGVRGSSSIRGTADNGCPAAPVGIDESPSIKVIALLQR